MVLVAARVVYRIRGRVTCIVVMYERIDDLRGQPAALRHSYQTLGLYVFGVASLDPRLARNCKHSLE